LSADDFLGKPPDGSPLGAWSEFEYELDFQYNLHARGAARTATLSGVEIVIVVRRDKSWNRRPQDALLLDHEQGHFDIMQIHALEAQVKLTRDLKTADVLQAVGGSRAQAAQRLRAQIAVAIEPFFNAAQEAHLVYDKNTSRGADARAQAESRRQQRERLAELQAELARVNKR
jgi:hypothetical protein